MAFPAQKWGHSSPKKRKRPKTEFERQVATLDKYFSEYIRLSNMDENGLCTCFTCGAKKPWNKRKTHCGHFVGKSASTYRVRWDEKNVACQCYNCNTNKSGMQWVFGKKIDAIHGLGTAENLQILSTKSFNPLIFDMETKIKTYREKVRFIKKRYGIA